MENQPSFDRIIGPNEAKKEIVKEWAVKEYLKTGKEIFGEDIVSPEENEKAAIIGAVGYANNVAASYGATRTTDPERVFILRPGTVSEKSNGKVRHAKCNALNQTIGVDRSESTAILASAVVHEAFHLSSYQAVQILEDGANRLYRSGIEMIGREEEGTYFSIAQEAIVAILSRKFFDEVVSKDSAYQEDMKYTIMIKDWLVAYAENNPKDEKFKERLLAISEDILILPKCKNIATYLYQSEKDDDFKYDYLKTYLIEIDKSETCDAGKK